jgi:hypothetical protein
MKLKVSLFILCLGAFFTMAVLTSYTSPEKSDSISVKDTAHTLPQIIKAITLDKNFDFAGERVPTENFDVRERLDRELLVNSYWHSATVQNIKLANRFFPVIEPILRQEGVPDDFKYLAVAESGLRNATSSAGAKGFWQFLKSTGKEYGMEINDEVDERYQLEIATKAACKYLRKQKAKLGSWTLAAAAYNAGSRRISDNLAQQGMKSYYDINLNEETGRYVFRIMAMKEILTNPEAYGFQISESEKYAPYQDLMTISYKEAGILDLKSVAINNRITYRMLKVYNPWLLDSKITMSGKKEYFIKVPRR